tara:strand:+ start:351 stop:1253 length:903 start_codon:yes stop_codon:yes gene_type:complete
VTPARRRQVACRAQRELGVSERRACNAIGQPRSTQRHKPKPRDGEAELVKRMKELAKKNPRYGYRRICACLQREGYRVNRKRIHRLWRKEGLKVARKQRKRRRLGHSGNSVKLRKASHKDEVWCMDFVHDQTDDAKMVKVLPILDEYTREWLGTSVERSINAEGVIATLEALVATRGAPAHIRSDNGPEFIAEALKDWLATKGAKTLYIEPGAPWENAYSESFNSRLRDELLDRELFGSLAEAKVVLDDHRHHYNHDRPHSSLEYLTPVAFAAKCQPLAESTAMADGTTAHPRTLVQVGT